MCIRHSKKGVKKHTSGKINFGSSKVVFLIDLYKRALLECRMGKFFFKGDVIVRFQVPKQSSAILTRGIREGATLYNCELATHEYASNASKFFNPM